jgi:hypothetical protein
MRRWFLVALLLVVCPAAARAQDAFDLHRATVSNAPADIADWPVTTIINRAEVNPEHGVTLTFPAQATWPDVTPPGWTGALQYTVWVVTPAGEATSGIVQMWRGRDGTGAFEHGSFVADFNTNWAYDDRWGALAAYHPHAGDIVGFFVSAGNARGESAVTSIRARSNVVAVTLADRVDARYDRDALPIVIVPDRDDDPTLAAQIVELRDRLAIAVAALVRLEARVVALESAAAIPTGCTASVFGYRGSCTLQYGAK